MVLHLLNATRSRMTGALHGFYLQAVVQVAGGRSYAWASRLELIRAYPAGGFAIEAMYPDVVLDGKCPRSSNNPVSCWSALGAKP